ncbi:MAG: ribonuclease M5 [Anaeroplasma sp.]|uniref:ribonuclease M5 n=1 Tax=Anaeroplasma sp. TaxID=1872523 RepID=UPI002A91943F|nr:ribonuclease M5 [Anaeroplasma sp.]MDY5983315.1 ribonuclease M5 [Anaeroplasma sp.]
MDIIVVEGTHDEIKVKAAYPNAECVITNGSEISKETIELIKELAKRHRIIVFTDPDSPGERIRSIITNEIPNASQAFLRKKDCISNNKKKVGIEHASIEAIRQSLENVYTPSILIDTITIYDLYSLGLIGDKNSKILRDKISFILNIGKPNAKTFLKRLNLLQITKGSLRDLLCKVK